MNKYFITFCLLLFSINSFAQTDVSGNIDTIWTKAGSPYNVVGNIIVDTLTIEPGVEIWFDGNYNFEVTGLLTAVGMECDSIIFKRDVGNTSGYKEISFKSASENCELAFCRIEGTTDNGIFIEGCSPLIRNCRITNNDNNGIYVSSSGELVLSNSIVSGNGNNGIATDGGNAELTNCIVSYNTQQGIVQQGSADSLTLTNTVVAYNSGPGIITFGGTVSVTNSIIYYNTQQIVNSDGSVTVVYSDIQGEVFSGRGNINDDPEFEDNSTFKLKIISPCIDEGDSSVVFNDIYFPPSLGTEINDMGAYGGPLAGKWYDPLYVVPLSIDFGDVTVEDTEVNQVTVKNYGDTLLNVTSISIRGISGGDFLVDTVAFFLEPMESSILNVNFNPSEEGARNDSLDIISDGGEKSVSLTGKGVVPDIWLPITSLNFEEVQLGDSLSIKLKIYNMGKGTLYISDISSGNPVFTFNKTVFSIPSYGIDSVKVVFKPDSGKSYNDTLLITSNDPDSYENPAEVTLTGAGLAPIISVNPDPLNFSGVVVGDDSTMSISVSNKGNLELIVNEGHITGIDSAKFSIVNWQFPDTLQPDSSKDIQITFSPDSWGAANADLQIKSNSYYNSTLQVSLKGTGLAPAISVNPNSLNFGSVNAGDDSVRSIYISNIGNMDLHVDTIEIIGVDSTLFSIVTGQQGHFTINPNDSSELSIKFSSTSLGDKETVLRIVSDDPCPDRDTLDIALTAKGLTPHIYVSKDPLNFNAVTVDSQRTLYLPVKNNGDGKLLVHAVTITGENSSDFEILSGGAPFTIPAGSDSQLIAIKFLPASIGEKSTSLKIISNDPDPDRDTLNIALIGKGVIPDISVRDSLDFNAVTVDSQRTLYLPVKNEGGGNLYVQTTEIIGIDSSDFEIISGGAPFTIPAGSDSHSIELSFSPATEGEKTAELRIVSNDPDVEEDTLQIHLKGEGVKPVIHFDTSLISLILGSNYTFQVYITSEKTEIKSAWLYSREGGKQGFNKLKLNKEEVNDSIWSADINPNYINERGIEYYLEVTYDKTTIMFPDNGPINPAIAVVNIPSLAFPNRTLANAYQKISLPLNSGNQNLKDLLEDDLGKYDNTQYRLFDWDQAKEEFIELTDLNIKLPAGKAVWLITKDSINLDIENCKSMNTGADYPISLHAGWNMIGMPFAFPVDWSEVVSEVIQGGKLYYYDGSGWDNTVSIMRPFMGYAVYSLRDTILKIPPEEAQTLGKQMVPSVYQDDEWGIQIKASKGEFKDDYNFAGVRQDACDLGDRFDVFEAPLIGKFVSLYFEQPEWNNYKGGYAADYREADKEGYWFEFKVISNFSGRTALTFEAQNLPENFDWQVVSSETQVKYPKGKITTNKTNRVYKLAVGTEGFLSGELSEYKEMPDEFKLSQNYPNPFNPVTNIEYQLPRGGYISLEIYDILGRKVKTLHKNLFKEAGYYKVQWDGSNNMNKKAASGIYFLYLRGDSYAKAVKMLLQR